MTIVLFNPEAEPAGRDETKREGGKRVCRKSEATQPMAGHRPDRKLSGSRRGHVSRTFPTCKARKQGFRHCEKPISVH
jgi:hypothetical protein